MNLQSQCIETIDKYNVSFDNCFGIIKPGETRTCAITNNDKLVIG
jgi:hypothetical protein